MRTPLQRALCLISPFLLAAGCAGNGGTRSASTPTVTVTRTHTLAPTPSPTEPATPTRTPSDNPVLDLPLDATIALPGLTATVDVAIDSLGMIHVYGPDEKSVIFLQGYQTAHQRFWEMDVFRRLAEGRLSEILGSFTVSRDVEMRTLFTTRDGRRLEEALWERLQRDDPEAAVLARAYADGVNAWLADLRAGRNGATLPPEYTFPLIALGPDQLEEWRPQDTLAIGRLQAYFLSESLGEEIARAERAAGLPEALYKDVFRSAPAAPATVLPAPSAASRGRADPTRAVAPQVPPLPPLPVLRSVREMLERLREANPLGRDEHTGSNNWIVAPARSATGHAMLANDPHLQLFNPPIWHMIQLDSGANRVGGVMFPGLAGIILGHNDFGAWGGTVAVFDVTDVYVEQITTPPDYPASPRTVLFNGQQVPLLRIAEPIHVKGSEPVIAVIEVVPHHGPMVPDPNLDDEIVGLAASGMSVRWTGHEISLDSAFLVGLNRARNVEEFKAAIRHFAVGAQNWVWADVQGDIAYFPYALIPQRPPGTIPYLPMDGTGTAEWLRDDAGNTLWLPEEKIPQAVNPPQGFLATANNDQIGNTLDNDPLNDETYLTFAADAGFRAQRIHALLSNEAGERPPGAPISMADMSAYQYDTASLEAAALLPFLSRAARNRPDLVTPEMQDAIDRLEQWAVAKPGSPACHVVSGVDAGAERADVPPRKQPVSDEEKADAVASSLFAAFETRLWRALIHDDFDGSGFPAPGGDDAIKAMLHLLRDEDATDPAFIVHTRGPNGESTLWDDRRTPEVETRDEILLRALRDGIAFLRERFGSDDPTDWLWGRIHQVRFQHFFGQAGLNVFDLGNFPAPGGRNTVNPADFSLNSDNFVFSSGPSKRFVIDLDPAGVRAVSILPGGNNGNPGALEASVYNTINPDIHYGDHIPGWINGETFAYRVSRADVAADTKLHLRYVPQE